MLRPVHILIALLALAAAVLGREVFELSSRGTQRATSERDAQGRAARAESASARMQQELAEARAALGEATAKTEAQARQIKYLEAELAGAMAREAAVGVTIAARRHEEMVARRREEEERRAREKPMPEGVRLALQTLRDLLQADGHGRIRFLEARSIEERELRSVELVERHEDGLTSRYWRVDSVTFELDRAIGVLKLRMQGGVRIENGARSALAEGGEDVLLADVFGPDWEERLPYLVNASGTYPVDAEEIGETYALDTVSQESWRERFATLFAESTTALRFELRRIETMRGTEFGSVHVLGYANGNLAQGVVAERMTVVIDREAGLVELRFREGELRQRSGRTTIPDAGYRIELAGITPERADTVLLGRVESARAAGR